MTFEQAVNLAATVFRPPVWGLADSNGVIRLQYGSQADPVVDIKKMLAKYPSIKPAKVKAAYKDTRTTFEELLQLQNDLANVELLPTVVHSKEFSGYSYQPGGDPIRKLLWEAQGHEPAALVCTALVIVFSNRQGTCTSGPALSDFMYQNRQQFAEVLHHQVICLRIACSWCTL